MTAVEQQIVIPVFWINLIRNGVTFKGESIIPPDPMAAGAFEALFRAATSPDGTSKIVGDRFASIANGKEAVYIGERAVVGSRFDIGTLLNFWLQGGATPLQFMTNEGSMLTLGPGFGVSSDLLFWFGGFAAGAETCTKENGVLALTTNGKIYQGGVLTSSDTETSTAESDSTSGSLSIQTTHGPGDTANGNDITVRASYSFYATGSSSTPWSDPSAQLKLWETIGAGAETLVDTYDLPADFGTASSLVAFEPPALFTGFQQMSGSIEEVRTNAAATTRVYRWELVSRSAVLTPTMQYVNVNTTEPP
jgi:hypothetical protein